MSREYPGASGVVVDVLRANMRVAQRACVRLQLGPWRWQTEIGQIVVEDYLRMLPANQDGAQWDRKREGY